MRKLCSHADYIPGCAMCAEAVERAPVKRARSLAAARSRVRPNPETPPDEYELRIEEMPVVEYQAAVRIVSPTLCSEAHRRLGYLALAVLALAAGVVVGAGIAEGWQPTVDQAVAVGGVSGFILWVLLKHG